MQTSEKEKKNHGEQRLYEMEDIEASSQKYFLGIMTHN